MFESIVDWIGDCADWLLLRVAEVSAVGVVLDRRVCFVVVALEYACNISLDGLRDGKRVSSCESGGCA